MIQHQGAMMFKLSAIMFFNWIKKNSLLFKVLYCVPCHDEHNIEAPSEIADEISQKLVQCMVKAGEPFCTRATMGADVSIAEHWIH